MNENAARRGIWDSRALSIIEGTSGAVIVFDSAGSVVFANRAACQLFSMPLSRLIGRHADDPILGMPDAPFALEAETVPESPVATVLKTGRPLLGARYTLSPVRGGTKALVVDAAPLWSEMGILTAVAVTYRDETEAVARDADAQWMRHELETRRGEVETLLDMTERLNVVSGMVLSETMLSDALAEARQALAAEGAVVVYRAPGRPRVIMGDGLYKDVADDSAPPEEGIAAALLDGEAAVALDDTLNDARTSALSAEYGVRSAIVAPLVIGKVDVGAVYFTHNAAPHHFTAGEIQFATRFGHLLSLLIENTELVADLNERNRLADDYARIVALIHSTLERDEVVDRCLAEGSRVLGAQTASIAERAEGGIRVGFSSGWGDNDPLGSFVPNERDPHGGLAASERRVVAIDDAFNDERMSRPLAEEFNLRSVIVAPLIMRDEVIATLYFNFHGEPHRFTEPEKEFVEKLASSLSLALDNARLFESEKELLRDATVIQRTLSVAASQPNLHAMGEEVLAMLAEELGIARGTMYAFDADERALNALAYYNYAEEAAAEVGHLTLDRDLPTTRMIREQLAYVTNREESGSTELTVLLKRYGIVGQRWIALALRIGRGVVGTLGLVFDGDRPFTLQEIRLYRLVADQLAIAFEKTRLLEAEKEARRVAAQELASSTALLRVSFLLSQYTGEEEVTAALADALLTATSHTRVCVWLRGDSPGDLVLVAAAGEKTSPLGSVMHVPPSVLQGGADEDAWRSELLEPRPTSHASLPPGLAPHSGLLLPLARGTDTLGYVTVDSPASPVAFDLRERELLEAAVAQGAIALANAQLLRGEQRARSLNEGLRAVNEQLLSATDLMSALPSVLDRASGVIDADMAILSLDEEGAWRIASALGSPVELEGRLFARKTAIGLTLAAETQEPLFVADTQNDERANSEFARRVGMQSYMVLPLLGRQAVKGVAVFGFRNPRTFGPTDRVFAERFAAAMALALENASLLEERVEEARLSLELGRMQSELFSVHDEASVWSTSLAELRETLECDGVAVVADTPASPEIGFAAGELNADPSALVAALSSVDYRRDRSVWWAEAGSPAAHEIEAGDAEKTYFLMVSVPRPESRVGLVLQRSRGFSAQEMAFARRLGATLEAAARDARLLKEREDLVIAREEWLSGVSHDLRTPLAAVRGYAQLLASEYETPPEEVRREGGLILNQSDKIERLIEDMLLTFRIRAGALPLDLADVDVLETLRDVAATLAADEGTAPEQIQVTRARKPVLARADAKMLERALMNLGRNAIVHNPPGTTVRFAAHHVAGTPVITVTDDGSGMEQELLGRIFVRYERGSATSEGAAGTGLGMPIARQLVEAMGGTLKVASQPNVGTTVTLRLPRAEGQAPSPERRRRSPKR